MKFHPIHCASIKLAILIFATLCMAPHADAEGAYYPDDKEILFHPYPSDKDKRGWPVRYLGPVGISMELARPGMTMKISNIEPGSPADKTGKLKKGQIIESINGITLKNIDPRIILGNIITDAEAKDGRINLKIKDEGGVTVQIPVMGAYSPTWPVNCPKSDKIVRGLADLLAKQEKPSWGSVIFMLSTGEDKDVEVVKKWMKGIQTIGDYNWHKGYVGPGLCEYYLRTGDKSVLPVIKRMTEELKDNMYLGGWSGRSAPAPLTYSVGSGHVHASGVHCMSFLMMAKLCGVEVDEYMMKESWKQFYRFAGHGNVAYGNTLPEGGFRDNGKTSGLAFALGAATLLHPDGENSVYAKARDNCAMKAFYATNWFHSAHTGGGMGEIWHHTAINQIREKRPEQYRSYMDTRRWVMDLSRRWDGSIAIAGMDDRYNRSVTDCDDGRDWGTYFALTYTLHRKKLQLFGAPRSPYAAREAVPIPWGNKADEIYLSNEPIPGGPLTMQDILKETVEKDSSILFLTAMDDENVSDQTLIKYMHHPEYGYREGAVRALTQHGRYHLVLPLLKHSDTRIRQCGLMAIAGLYKGNPIPQEQITPEMMAEVSKMVMDPDESWWTAMYAIRALGRADKDIIAKHGKRLLDFLSYYDSPWLEADACKVLINLSCEPQYYKGLLPVLIKKVAMFRADHASRECYSALGKALSAASPEIKKFAEPFIKETYMSIPPIVTEPHTGAVFNSGGIILRRRMDKIAGTVGAQGLAKKLPKTTLVSYKSRKESDKLHDDGKFQDNPKVIGSWYCVVSPSAEKPDEIMPRIQSWIKEQTKDGASLPAKPRNAEDTITIQPNGKLKSNYYFYHVWSGNMIINTEIPEAVRMEVVTVEGREFLVVERGNFDTSVAKVPSDYHCGYHIYIKGQ